MDAAAYGEGPWAVYRMKEERGKSMVKHPMDEVPAHADEISHPCASERAMVDAEASLRRIVSFYFKNYAIKGLEARDGVLHFVAMIWK